MIYVLGGGGASLNFSIVGGTTQPTGKENLIWVDTSTAITSWEFSATEPTSPVAGMVWFRTGTSASAPINAVKKNGIWIYPTGVSQYISGEWVSKIAQTYQSGQWISWTKYLIKGGRESEPNSLVAVNKRTEASGSAYTPEITNRDTGFTVKMSGAGPYALSSGSMISAEDIDFSPFSKVIADGTVVTRGASMALYLSIFNRNNTTTITGAIASKRLNIDAVGNFSIDLDIPAGTGSYALAFSLGHWSQTTLEVRINNFYLIP